MVLYVLLGAIFALVVVGAGVLATTPRRRPKARAARGDGFAAIGDVEAGGGVGLDEITFTRDASDVEVLPRPAESFYERASRRVFEWEADGGGGTVRWTGPGAECAFVRRSPIGGGPSEFAASVEGAPLGPPNPGVRRALAACSSFADRMGAFRAAMDGLRVSWEVGRVEFKVGREELLEGGFALLSPLEPARWRQPFFINFEGEAGLDAGGLSREYFRLASAALFDPSRGLFKVGSSENLTYQIADDDDAALGNDDANAWFAFAGKLLGKALLEGHHFADSHLNSILLKHLACEPIVLDDLILVDNELFHSLDQMRAMDAETIEALCLTFSVEHAAFGAVTTKDLIPGGREFDVNAGNVDRFLEARLKERVFDVCRSGLDAFLGGVHSVVPREALMLLSARELELALFGIPNIDVGDWKESTAYKSEYAADGAAHPVIAWFWEEVESWDEERRAMLLQWTTGTSRVPVQGFDHLQGRDGVLRQFTITSVQLSAAVYPRAHTCFNRIDLPLFQTREQLSAAFDVALDPNTLNHFSMD